MKQDSGLLSCPVHCMFIFGCPMLSYVREGSVLCGLMRPKYQHDEKSDDQKDLAV